MNGKELNLKSVKTLGGTPCGTGGTPVLPMPMRRAGRVGFTLIELLAVIAIIGLLAGLVVGLSGLAVSKQREARMRGEHARLVTAIDAYKAELGFYPQDNTNTSLSFIERAGRNSLFYELSGATFANDNGGQFTTVHNSEVTTAADLNTALSVRGIQNSSRDKKGIPYRGISFKPSQLAQLDTSGNVWILVAPLKGPYDATFKIKNSNVGANPWFYNLSGTNKHNIEGYDLWTEYLAGSKKILVGGVPTRVPQTNVVGNWKE